ncbi:hypothetical protein FGU46_03900 [Methanobacterium sp. CWC-01]|uniref:hypothetical protein n=1 Tax=Methanobacterium aridiramus TaxID=2584467 RepID=UPI002577F241|nr:hypothetical protein [Methanobacterium sp. CWC-01]WJI09300.1 hypothetical protein FGU46_03900 [Methanobacterium sp. CWC-01]
MDENLELIKVEIDSAEKMCESLDDPDKTIFKTILKSLNYIINEGKNENLESSEVGEQVEDMGVSNRINYLLKEAEIDLNHIEKVFRIEEDDFKVVATIEGKNEVEKQIKATLPILTVYYYCFGKEKIQSRDLASKLRWLGIKSLANLSKNLKRPECKPFVIVSGTGNNLTYQILNQGLKKGVEIIRELSSGSE